MVRYFLASRNYGTSTWTQQMYSMRSDVCRGGFFCSESCAIFFVPQLTRGSESMTQLIASLIFPPSDTYAIRGVLFWQFKVGFKVSSGTL